MEFTKTLNLFQGRMLPVKVGGQLTAHKLDISGEEIQLVMGFPNPTAWVDIAFNEHTGERHRMQVGQVLTRPFRAIYVWTSAGSSFSDIEIVFQYGQNLISSTQGSDASPIQTKKRVHNVKSYGKSTIVNGVAATNVSYDDPAVDYDELFFVVRGPGAIHISFFGPATAQDLEVDPNPGKIQGPFPVTGNTFSFLCDGGFDCTIYHVALGYKLGTANVA